MKASVPIERARELLSDESNDPRWTTPELVDLCELAEAEIYRLRPDSVYTDAIVTTAPGVLENENSDLHVRGEFSEALAYFMASRALVEDSERGGDPGLASTYLSEFGRLLS